MSEKRRLPRRWRVVLWILGSAAAVVGAAALALALSDFSPPAQLTSHLPQNEIPTGWTSPAEPTAVEPPAVSPGSPIPYATSGRLALVANGKPFGDESYELHITEDGTLLTSSGRFSFKVALATIQVTFEQTLETERDLRPTRYAVSFRAPLGLDRSIRATVAGDRAVVERSGKTEEIGIDPRRAFTLGTFSTYALLPRLFALRQAGGSASFDALVLGGPPSQQPSGGAEGLPVMTVALSGRARLRAGDAVLDVDRYRLTSSFGESDLYARDGEFLALHATSKDGNLWVYRSDFFPDGVEIEPVSPP